MTDSRNAGSPVVADAESAGITATSDEPNFVTHPDGTYLADRNGLIWMVVRDGAMVTRADYSGAHSAGIVWLEQTAGPLIVVRVP
jgi:hypothetical protein